MQKKVYKKRIKNIDELYARILTAWNEMDQWFEIFQVFSLFDIIVSIISCSTWQFSESNSILLFLFNFFVYQCLLGDNNDYQNDKVGRFLGHSVDQVYASWS